MATAIQIERELGIGINEQFDGVNDYHFALRFDSTLDHYIDWGNQGSLTDLDFDYATNQPYRLNGGWAVYEIAIKLSSAQIVPGSAFGFEVQINEDDDGGDRDAKWSWAERTAEHRAWFDPRSFGTAVLQPR